MELVREILMQVEGGPPGQTWIDVAINGYDKNTIAEQVRLLSEAGYLVARDHGDDWKPVCLTWEGKDFLSAAKNKTIWSRAMHGSTSKDATQSPAPEKRDDRSGQRDLRPRATGCLVNRLPCTSDWATGLGTGLGDRSLSTGGAAGTAHRLSGQAAEPVFLSASLWWPWPKRVDHPIPLPREGENRGRDFRNKRRTATALAVMLPEVKPESASATAGAQA